MQLRVGWESPGQRNSCGLLALLKRNKDRSAGKVRVSAAKKIVKMSMFQTSAPCYSIGLEWCRTDKVPPSAAKEYACKHRRVNERPKSQIPALSSQLIHPGKICSKASKVDRSHNLKISKVMQNKTKKSTGRKGKRNLQLCSSSYGSKRWRYTLRCNWQYWQVWDL